LIEQKRLYSKQESRVVEEEVVEEVVVEEEAELPLSGKTGKLKISNL
jgi:hypothetical protein